MNLNDYQLQAMRTSPEDHDRLKNGCLGLIGESGEIVDIVKKYMFQSKADTPLPVDKLIDEMGDVLWYIAETVSGMGLDLWTALKGNGELEFKGSITLEECAVLLSSVATSTYTRCFVEKNYEIAIYEIHYIYATLMEMCKKINTTIDEVAERNIAKLKKRYPDGFDPERSMNRPEYTQSRTEHTESAFGILFEERNRPV